MLGAQVGIHDKKTTTSTTPNSAQRRASGVVLSQQHRASVLSHAAAAAAGGEGGDAAAAVEGAPEYKGKHPLLWSPAADLIIHDLNAYDCPLQRWVRYSSRTTEAFPRPGAWTRYTSWASSISCR
jgi:hypothetical protein